MFVLPDVMTMPGPELSALIVLLPALAAALATPVMRLIGPAGSWLLALFPLGAVAVTLMFLRQVAAGTTVNWSRDWAADFGLSFSITLDGLSLTFCLLISVIGTLVVLYSGAYLKHDPGLGRFMAFILAFMTAMLGLVLADNLLMLFVFWELTSITSFLLIGFRHESEASRRAALQALVITGGGGLVMLAGFMLLTALTGETAISGLAGLPEVAKGSAMLVLPMALVLVGAFTKSAQFPFHFWLPNAMQAPTPVSAFLHSATMVKAGVYLVMRFNPLFAPVPGWGWLLVGFGGVTFILGAVLALRQTDLKLMLAQTTVASLGLMIMLTGIGTDLAIKAACAYLIAHALFKGALFMVAGVIDHESGTRDSNHLSGLGRAMPLTFAAGFLAALSMGGLPFFLGFHAKEEIYLAADGMGGILLAALIGNAMMFAIAFAVGFKPFAGPVLPTPKHAHDGPLGLMAGPVLLGLGGLLLALVPDVVHGNLTAPMASAIAGKSLDLHIPLLPHWGMPLLLSGMTILLGLVMYRFLRPIRATLELAEKTIGWGPDHGFDQLISGLVSFAWRFQRLIQPGRLEIYITVTFIVVAFVVLAVPILASGGHLPMPHFDWPQPYEAAFMAIAVLGLLQVLFASSRLVAIVSLGIQGFSVAVLYLLFGAPDLAFTQFMIETLSVVILALVMTRLRLSPSDHRPWTGRLGDGSIAIACGAGLTLMLLLTVQVPFDRTLSDFFSQHSKLVAHGANVVNVIIVDFRGTDTLGEIAVVAITGLAILALIRLRVPSRRPADNNPDLEG